jgi:dihydrofolate reductase
MSMLRFQLAVSLDGYVAGPDQSVENPLGVGGLDLHQWAFELEAWRKEQGQEGGTVNPSSLVVEESQSNVGAVVMGRNMFGGGRGPWKEDPAWRGWWGENPPYHTPVFVLTHHPREPLDMEGGTTFIFITDGIESAFEQAKRAARDQDVLIGGGANVVQQYLGAGLVDEFELHFVPILLGDGERLLDPCKIIGLRVQSGDDASCLNLYQPTQPRILAVTTPLGSVLAVRVQNSSGGIFFGASTW